jgi:threonine/homoserine/homoserine lactone efflux protein
MALLALSLTFLVIGIGWCLCLAWFSSKVGDRLRHKPGLSVTLNRVAGVVFILLALRLAFSP